MAALRFYLIARNSFEVDADLFERAVSLTEFGTWPTGSGFYFLVAGYNETAQHTDIIATWPQPSGWTFTIEEAQRFVRRNGLTHLWWVIDQFVAKIQE